MKKALIFLLLFLMLIGTAGCGESGNRWYGGKAYITYGSNGIFEVDVSNYSRISHNWIVITATDGTQYSTSDYNVLIIKEADKK